MLCHLVIPALLPPPELAAEFLAGLALPALSQLLSRGHAAKAPETDYDAWWCKRFAIARQQDWPLAPISLSADGGVPGDGYWLRADPVHLQVNRDQLILGDSSTFPISAAEAVDLSATLNAHFADKDCVFEALNPRRWYLRLSAVPDLQCTPLSAAAGKNIDPLLPTGADARRFRVLINEAQMLLFDHPVNEKREAEGRAPVNSIWLWGGGWMPALQRPPIAKVWTKEHVSWSLATVSAMPVADLPANAGAWLGEAHGKSAAREPGEHLVVVDHLLAALQYGDSYAWQQALQKLEEDWFAPLLFALRKGRISQLALTGFDEQRTISATATRSGLWKFWRAARSLSGLLGVP